MYISLPSRPPSERLISIATVVVLHLAVGAALVVFAQPVIRALMEPVHIQLLSDATEKVPEPPAPEPPKVKPMESRPRPTQQPQPQQPQVTPILQTQAAAPANAPVMEAPPMPREMPVAQATPATGTPAPAAPAEPVVAPRHDADYLHNPRPEYPRASRALSEEGTVFFNVQVSEDGRPLQVLMTKSSGFQRLDRAAREAVVAWRFEPARQGTKPVVGWVNFPVIFSLK